MHIEFLVEELSAEEAIRNFVPKIIGPSHTIDVHHYQGKTDLMQKLPLRLEGYRRWLPQDWRIVVLIDEDRQDCKAQKHRLESMARQARFFTKTAPGPRNEFTVLNRIAVEELEAWFLGDVEALVAAYPRTPRSLASKARYHDPDNISGGTWEALEQVMKKAGYYPSGLPKVETARNVSMHMEPTRNRSRSFQVFRDGLIDLVR